MGVKQQVTKSTLYKLRLKPSEKHIVEMAAARAGLGTAEFWQEVSSAVAYTVLRYDERGIINREEFEQALGAAIASIVYPGMVLKDKPEEPEESEPG